MTNNKKIRHCEQSKALRGNSQQPHLSKKVHKLQALPCLWIASATPRNDGIMISFF